MSPDDRGPEREFADDVHETRVSGVAENIATSRNLVPYRVAANSDGSVGSIRDVSSPKSSRLTTHAGPSTFTTVSVRIRVAHRDAAPRWGIKRMKGN
jgi:hypothetical protein